MADGHESAVMFEEHYNHHKVAFYIDLFESASVGRQAPWPCAADDDAQEQQLPPDGDTVMSPDQGYNTSSEVTGATDDVSGGVGDVCHPDSQTDTDAGDDSVAVSEVAGVVTEEDSLEAVLAKFERHERSFRDQFILPEAPTETPLTPPPVKLTSTSGRQYVGLEHLDNLVRIMTQLSQLRDENSHLRKRCDFLQNTKSLLKIQNDMVHMKSMRSKTKPHTRLMQYLSTPGHTLRARESSRSLLSPDPLAGAMMEPLVRKPVKLHHRSQSMGSIDMLDVEMDAANESHKSEEKPVKERGMRSRESKKSKRFSKWYRMKKVFTGKPEPSHKPDSSGTISAEQLMKVNSRRQRSTSSTTHDKPPMLQHTKSVDAGVLAREKRSVESSRSTPQFTPSPQPPCSPSSYQSEPPMVLPSNADIADLLDDSAVSPPADDAGVIDSEAPTPVKRSGSMASLSSDDDDDAAELEETSLPLEELVSDDGDGAMTHFLSVTTSSEPTRQSSTQSLHYSTASDDKDAFFATRPLTPETGYSSVMEIPHDSETEHVHTLGPMYYDDFGITDTPDDMSQCGDMQKHWSRSAWYRVKEIIHTRKDSLKRKTPLSSSSAWSDNPADSPIEGEISPESGSWADHKVSHYDLEEYVHEKSGSDPTSAVSESPKLVRRYTSKSRGRSPRMASPQQQKRHSLKSSTELIGPAASAKSSQEFSAHTGLTGSHRDDISRRMAEWQDKRQKDGCVSADEESGGKDGGNATNFTEDFIRKMEEWERMRGQQAAGVSYVKPRTSSQDTSTCSPDSATPSDHAHTPGNDDIQQHLSESFTKTVQEWERVREMRVREAGSPPVEGKIPEKRSRLKDRSKSRERDRSRHKYEKERQKIERKEQKIEKERQRLEKRKMKLDVSLETNSSSSDGRSVDGLSHDFRRKLQEWESFKGLKTDTDTTSGAAPVENVRHTRSKSEKQNREGRESPIDLPQGRERVQSDSSIHMPASLMEGVRTKPGATVTAVDAAPEDVDEGGTSGGSTVALSDGETKMATPLTVQLAEKEEYIGALMNEVQQLTDRINMLNKQHTDEIENYRRELWATSKLGRYTIESDLLARSLNDLRQGLLQLRQYGDSVASKKQHIEMKVKEDTQARNKIESILLEEIEKLQMALVHKSESSKCTHVFEQLYDYIRKAQKQLHDLKIGILERNQVIEEMQRHLLVQEVTNKLLEADNERWEMELQFFRRQRKAAILKRWQTFTGRDIPAREDGTLETLRVTKRRKRRSQVAHSCKLIQPYLRRISHGNIDSLMLHFDLLDQLKQQIGETSQESTGVSEGVQVSEAVQVEGGGHVTNSVAAQTVMTLCNCSYVPDARMLATVHHGAAGGQVVISRATVEDIDREVTAGQAAEQPGRAKEVRREAGTDVKKDVTCPKEETRKDVEGVATVGREEEEDGGEEEGDVGKNSTRKTVAERMVEMVDEAIQTDVSSAESDQLEMVKCTQGEQEKMDSASEVEMAKATAEIKIPLTDDHDEVKCLGETGVKATAAVVSDIKATNSAQGEVSTTSKVASGLSALAEKITEKTGKLVKKKSIDAATDGKINLPLLNAGLTAAVPNQGILATHTDTQLSHASVLEEPATTSAVATEPVVQTTKTAAATEAVLQELDTVTHQAEVMMKEAADQKRTDDKTDTEHETSPVVTKQPAVVDETVVCDVIAAPLSAVESATETQSADEIKPVAAPVRDDINRFDLMDIVSDPGVGERRLRPAHRANSEPHLLRLRQPKRPNLDELFCPDSDAPAAQPPASPMIRSKYPRRMRLSDLKVEQLYPADSNTWKATPPRRMIRHRKQSTEKPAMSSGPASPTGTTESFDEMTNVRQRTNSDGSLMRPKSLQLMPTHAADGSMGFVPIGRGSGRRPNLPVFDVLGVNEPFSRDHLFRRSPGPSLHKPKMSPVRRLKSAVELMADSARTRRTRSASTSRLGRSSPSHSFSLKVGDRSHRSARQSRKDAPSHSSSEDLSEPQAATDTTREGSHRLSLPTEQMQPHHKLSRESLVNQGQVRKLTETFTSGRESARPPQGRGLRGREVPHQGTVAERTDIFKKRLSSSSVESDISGLFPRRRGVSLDRHRRREPADQSDRGRPRLVVWTPSKSGAVSSLCKQAMLVDVQEGKNVTEDSSSVPCTTRRRSQQSEGRRGSDEGSQTRSEGKKSHKFLEGAWLQKPKRFFKVSNGFGSDLELDVDADSYSLELYSSTSVLPVS